MSADVITLKKEQSLPLAEAMMHTQRVRHLPVVDDEDVLVGLVTHRDLLAAQLSALSGLSAAARADYTLTVPVERVMSAEVWTVRPETPAVEAIWLLIDHKFGCVPVVNDAKQIIGIVTEADFLDMFVKVMAHYQPITVAQLMTTEVITLRRDQTLPLAEKLMGLHRIRHLPVIGDDDRLLGVITHRDLLAASYSTVTDGIRRTPNVQVRDLLTSETTPWTVTSDSDAVDAARVLIDNRFGCLPVIDERALVGIITEADFLVALARALDGDAQSPPRRDVPVSYYMSEPVRTIGPGDDLNRAYERMAEHDVSALAVVDASGELVGVISRTDLLAVSVPRMDTPRLRRLRERSGAAGPTRTLRLPTRRVDAVMTRGAVTARPDEPVAVAAKRMIERGVHRLFVVHGDGAADDAKAKLIGVLGTNDILAAVRDLKIDTPVSSYMVSTLLTVDLEVDIAAGTRFLEQAAVHGVVVRDGDWPIGVFTQREALASRDLAPQTPIEQVMSRRLICIPGRMPIHHVAAQAAALGAQRVIVIQDGQLCGILSGSDFVRACATVAPA